MSKSHENNSAAWTLNGFAQALGKALLDIHKRNSVRISLEQAIQQIPNMVQPETSGETVTIPEIAPEPDDSYVGNGLHLSDLNDSAKAKREAARVSEMRREAYRFLRHQVEYGRYTEDEVTRHFPALGFPRPYKTSYVSAEVYKNGKWHSMSFTLPGEHNRDAVEAKFAAAGDQTPTAEILSAFEDAGNTGGAGSNVRYCDVTVTTEWPSYSEVK